MNAGFMCVMAFQILSGSWQRPGSLPLALWRVLSRCILRTAELNRTEFNRMGLKARIRRVDVSLEG